MVNFRSLALLLLLTASQSVAAVTPENDLKLIIDVSGSMVKNDPDNLRRPAVNLLMKLLPEDARVGVWLFGHESEPLVPFSEATSHFKDEAIRKSSSIHSKGMLTDIGGALEAAMLQPPLGGKAILLSDGMVDLGPDASLNAAEEARIEHRIIPQLKGVGAEVHTVALSANADKDMLSTIAMGTGGLFETARTPEDLTRIFLRLFDDAVIQDRLPLEEGRFLVDSSVKEFTLLTFHSEQATPIQIQAPGDTYYLKSDHPDSIRWYQDAGYDLITVRKPAEGQWRLFADGDPLDRVTVLSDLKLEVTNLDNMLHEASFPHLEAVFYQGDKIITDGDFLSLLDVQLIVMTPSGKRIAKPLADFVNGTYSSDLDVFAGPGRYQIKVNVDGKTFQREVIQEIEYVSPAKIAFSPETAILSVRPVAVGLLNDALRLIARVEDAEGGKKLVPLVLKDDIWRANLSEFEPGEYKAIVHIKGEAASAQPLDFDLETIPIKIVDPSAMAQADDVSETDWSMQEYLVAAGIGLGNLFLIAVFAFLWRRKSKAKAAEEDETDSEGNEIEGEDSAAVRAENETEAADAPEPPGKGANNGVDAWDDEGQSESDRTEDGSVADSVDDVEDETEADSGTDLTDHAAVQRDPEREPEFEPEPVFEPEPQSAEASGAEGARGEAQGETEFAVSEASKDKFEAAPASGSEDFTTEASVESDLSEIEKSSSG